MKGPGFYSFDFRSVDDVLNMNAESGKEMYLLSSGFLIVFFWISDAFLVCMFLFFRLV